MKLILLLSLFIVTVFSRAQSIVNFQTTALIDKIFYSEGNVNLHLATNESRHLLIKNVGKLKTSVKIAAKAYLSGTAFYDDNIYVLLTNHKNGKVNIVIEKYDLDLALVETKVVHSFLQKNKGKEKIKCYSSFINETMVFCHLVEKKGVVRFGNINLNTLDVRASEAQLEVRSSLDISDFDIDEKLNCSIVFETKVNYSGLYKKNDMERYFSCLLVFNSEMQNQVINLDTQKGFNRIFRADFNNDILFIGSLQFHSPSNVFKGNGLIKIDVANDFKILSSCFIENSDFIDSDQWNEELSQRKEEYSKEINTEYTKKESLYHKVLLDIVANTDETILFISATNRTIGGTKAQVSTNYFNKPEYPEFTFINHEINKLLSWRVFLVDLIYYNIAGNGTPEKFKPYFTERFSLEQFGINIPRADSKILISTSSKPRDLAFRHSLKIIDIEDNKCSDLSKVLSAGGNEIFNAYLGGVFFNGENYLIPIREFMKYRRVKVLELEK